MPRLKSDLGNEFFRPGLPCEVIFRPKSLILAENLNLLQTRLSLKTRLGAGLFNGPDPEQKKFSHFFQTNQIPNMPVHNIKVWPAVSTYVWEKGGSKKTVIAKHPVEGKRLNAKTILPR